MTSGKAHTPIARRHGATRRAAVTRAAAAFVAAALVLCALAPVGAHPSAKTSRAGLASAVPSFAITAYALEPAQAAAAEDSASSEASAPADVDVNASSDGQAAEVDGASFSLDGFSRAQTGSNRPVDGTYYGYAYYAGGAAGKLSMVATENTVVVYVPRDAEERLGMSLDDADDRATLQALLCALDKANAHGGAVVTEAMDWRFTDQQAVRVGEAVFSFDQQLSQGRYYDCVVGADGSDITDAASPSHVRLTHACFADLVTAGDAAITAPPTAFEQLRSFVSSIDYSPLWVTLRTTGVAIVIVFVLGLAAAWWCLRVSPRARDVLDTLFTIPMVLPPTVCGFLLLLLLGNNTALGRWFISIGFPLVFSWPATVIAAVVVSFPLMYRSARGAFESLDPDMLDAARTLGWSERRVFFKLMMPLAWSSIASGTVLAFARALGEFGATLFLAGNYLGITRTIPIAIYFEWMNGNTDVALFWTFVILVFSFLVILLINLWGRRNTRYRAKEVQQ